MAAQELLRLGLRSSEIALPLAGVACDPEHYPTLSRHLAAKYLRYCMIDSSARSVVIARLREALDDEFWGVRVAARCTMEIRGWEYHRPDNLTVVELCEGEDFRDRDPPGGLK